MERYDLWDYPQLDAENDVYNSSISAIREQHLNGGVLVYIEQINLDSKRQPLSMEIEVAGYRRTSYIGEKKVKLIAQDRHYRIESSLTQLLESSPVTKEVPIINFSFWNVNPSGKHRNSWESSYLVTCENHT